MGKQAAVSPFINQIDVKERLAMRSILCLLLATACGVLHAAVPELEERSPFRPGLWWNPEAAGSGLDIQRTDEGLFLVWYTYREDRSPVWYTAQGSVEAGRFDGDLLEHRWSQDAYAGHAAVGTVSIEVLSPERLGLAFSLPEGEGQWTLHPFLVDGRLPEIDHSGAWFQPQRSGFGLSLSHQGDFLFGAFFHYDHDGLPVWAVGDNGRDGRYLAMHSFRGACPACPQQSPSASAVGHLVLELGDGHGLSLNLDIIAGEARWTLHDQHFTILTLPAAARAADRMLVRMGNEAALTEALRRALLSLHEDPELRFSGGVDFSASPPPPPANTSALSGTNVQEAGVDEAALLVSDGDRVFAQSLGSGSGAPGRVRMASLDSDAAELGPPREIDVPLDPGIERPRAEGMLLDDERLVVIHGNEQFAPFGIGLWIDPWRWTEGRIQVDILGRGAADATEPQWRAVIDGHLLAARRVGDQLLLIHRHTPVVDGLGFAGSSDAIRAQNRAVLDATDLPALLPQIRIDGGEAQALLDPDRLLLPPTTDRAPRPDLMVLTRINLADPDDFEALGVLGYLDAFHISIEAVYLASSRYQARQDPVLGVYRPGLTTTDLHRIEVRDGRLDYRASGNVEGFLHWDPDRAAFRISEHEGRLRVLSESHDDIWQGMGRHRLSVLEESTITPGLLRTVSVLPNSQRPLPIGKPGEILYGTRFVGDRLYAVTFLAIDPLYVIDLSDPADPFIAGEVELPGFSDYLHPLPGGLLLGFGMEAIEETGWNGMPFAWFQGLKLSLFDVSDPGQPRVLQEMTLGKRGSESALLVHHHAFSILHGDGVRPTRFAIPMALHGEGLTRDPSDPPSTTYPWSRSGQFRFELEGEAGATRIKALDHLITRDSSRGDATSWREGGRRGGRSLLFEGGSLYTDGDRFWLADWASPSTLRGPH
jgi:hypothetical protein